jgi:hypothetical protein
MGWRLVILAAALALPAPAMASHMGQYVLYPTSHDVLGTVAEPDFQATEVLGPRVMNCVVDLPLGGAFSGHCGDDALRTGLGETIAPGCTGENAEGTPAERLPGQCGLWTVGLRPSSVAVIPPGTVPPPISERGMSNGQWPGRYAGAVRFLDGIIDQEAGNNPVTGGPTNTVALNRYLSEAGLAPSILPGSTYIWAWFGEWTDHNHNGVVDACFATCTAGAEVNEFIWRGGCTSFFELPNHAFAEANGYCAQDPNPNALGSHACEIGEGGPCANAKMDFWMFPGNHNPTFAGDMPGNQVLDWALRLGDCTGPPSCDDDSTSCDDGQCAGDPLFDIQNYVTPDGLGMDDRTGDNGAANVGDDTLRQWAGNQGNIGTFYGDDGLLITEIVVYGYNCATGTRNGLDLAALAGTAGGCTFVDVDRYPSVNPAIESLLVGGEDYPNGGLKGELRRLWQVAPPPCGTCQTPLIPEKVDSIVNSETVYEATLGPQQGHVNDLLIDPGWSREPNSPARTYLDAAGVAHTVAESYVETWFGSCEDIPVGDARNPTAAPDAFSLEAQHRGFCNTGPTGLGSAYSAHDTRARGWLDLQPLRHVVHGTPVTVSPPCMYCFYAPFVGFPSDSEQPQAAPLSVEDHTRTLGPGQYLFQAHRGTWNDRPVINDESLFPDLPGTTLVTYPEDNWINFVASTTGQWHYRDFQPLVCTTEEDAAGEASLHEAAECNPYFDGNVEDPQDYDLEPPSGGEFDGTPEISCSGTSVSLAPVDGVLDTQIIVIRNYADGIGPLLPEIGGGLPVVQAYGPGPVDPLVSRVWCMHGSFITVDELVWPQGNLGDDIVTFVTHDIPLDIDVDGDGDLDVDTLTDVDFYGAWGVPPAPIS